jgi:formylmethanofuran dehydrogenase subunit E
VLELLKRQRILLRIQKAKKYKLLGGIMKMDELLEVGLKFHGHKCPAMPLGYRCATAAMEKLGAERAQDKELYVIAETGKAHAAGCFLDGIMTATGCTYGKSNIEKKYYNKMAFTLIDVKAKRAVRVSLKPEFFEGMLNSPFVKLRKEGIPPQDISSETADPLIEKVLTMPIDKFLNISEVRDYDFKPEKGTFEIAKCVKCGEMAFTNKMTETPDGLVCMGCMEK